LRRPGEVLHLDHAGDGVDHLVESQEVDRDGGVVLGEGRLVGNLQVKLPQIDRDRPVDDRDQQPHPRVAKADDPPEAEDDQTLVLPDHPHRQHDEDAGNKHDQDEYTESDSHWGTSRGVSGMTSRTSPWRPTTSTRYPAGMVAPSAATAVHDSPATCTTPVGAR